MVNLGEKAPWVTKNVVVLVDVKHVVIETPFDQHKILYGN